MERTVSTSRQFIIFGGDNQLRGAVADLAEQVKGDLLGLLRIPDQWLIPTLIRLQEPHPNIPEVPPAALNISQTGSGLKIQLDFLVTPAMDPRALEREVLKITLLEMSYRGLPLIPAGAACVPPPDWLVEGILAWRHQSSLTADLLDSLTAKPPALAGFLRQYPSLLDSQSRALYCTTACALVATISQHENGPAQLHRYITDLPRAAPDLPTDFRLHFGWFGGEPEQAEKHWSATVKLWASEQRSILDTFPGTLQQLEELRRVIIAADATSETPLTLEKSAAALRPRVNLPVARDLAQRLVSLATHAHPLLRPIIVDYQLTAQSLANKKTRGLKRRVDAAGALLRQVCSRMQEVEDYMNWFEATQARTMSGDFQEYLHAAQNIPVEMHRRDALSVYLDAMSLQFRQQ